MTMLGICVNRRTPTALIQNPLRPDAEPYFNHNIQYIQHVSDAPHSHHVPQLYTHVDRCVLSHIVSFEHRFRKPICAMSKTAANGGMARPPHLGRVSEHVLIKPQQTMEPSCTWCLGVCGRTKWIITAFSLFVRQLTYHMRYTTQAFHGTCQHTGFVYNLGPSA